MATIYKKRFPNNPVNTSLGRPLVFEDIGDGFGFLATDDPKVIVELSAAVAAGRGGVSLSNQAEYDEALKKKSNSPRLNQFNKLRELQTAGLVTVPVQPDGVPVAVVPSAGAAVDKPAELAKPIVPPSPRLGKRKASTLP